MLSEASESISSSLLSPPVKPWEVSNPALNVSPHSNLNVFSPPAPPPPLIQLPAHDPQTQNYQNWIGSGGPSTGNYYNNFGSRFGYSPSYGSGYNSYPSSYYMNNGSFGSGPPAPGNYITSSLENTTRPLFDSLNHVLQAINHVACFVDSTVFAVWTSATAAGSVMAAIKSIKNVYLRKWIDSVRHFFNKIKTVMKTSTGRKKLLLLLSLIASIPLLVKALQTILKLEENEEKSIILPEKEFDFDCASQNNENELSSKGAFVRAIYPHDPVDKNVYLTLNPGDVILISKDDLTKLSSLEPVWIAGKSKNSATGYFPSNYVTVIK